MLAQAFFVIIGFYLIATLFYILRLLIGRASLSAVGLCVMMGATLIHGAALGIHFVSEGLRAGYFEYFQVTAFLLALVFIILRFTKRFHGSGLFFLTLIDIFLIYSLALDHPVLQVFPSRGGAYLLIHLASIFLSLLAFCLSLIAAVMFLLSERQIKHKIFSGWISKFPPLSLLDDLHYKALSVGFILFTFVIITGAGYSKVMRGHYLSYDLKQMGSILAWLFFATFLNLRVRQGFRGHKGMLLSLFGLGSMVILFIIGFK